MKPLPVAGNFLSVTKSQFITPRESCNFSTANTLTFFKSDFSKTHHELLFSLLLTLNLSLYLCKCGYHFYLLQQTWLYWKPSWEPEEKDIFSQVPPGSFTPSIHKYSFPVRPLEPPGRAGEGALLCTSMSSHIWEARNAELGLAPNLSNCHLNSKLDYFKVKEMHIL